jgi:hypothetical protein
LKSKLDDNYIAQGLYVKAFQINHLQFDAARDSICLLRRTSCTFEIFY